MSLLLENILQEYETVIVKDKHASLSHIPRVLLYLHQFQIKRLTIFLSSDVIIDQVSIAMCKTILLHDSNASAQ